MLVSEADGYIQFNVIDIEDWVDSDEDKKRRILNVSERVIGDVYPDYEIPENAIYEYCAVLAAYFNDTNRLQQYGVGSFGITGVASYTFKQGQIKELHEMIPRTAKDIIGKANGVKLTGRTVKDTVM